MTPHTAGARVKALAKINLDLRIVRKRSDGFHELRSVFQTISLGDELEIRYTAASDRKVELADCDIPDNLAVRAAEMLLDFFPGHVHIRLKKITPMGAGLGGGSSDAAAVLLALPALAGRAISLNTLSSIGARLGSDVPFFLYGGSAVAIGRGTELFPIDDAPSCHALLVAPDVHVSTAGAYAALSPHLTTESEENKIVSFQSRVWSGSVEQGANDFESVVFAQHPRLLSLKQRLIEAGAQFALMSGSGSALFGLFRTREEVSRAVEFFREERAFPISFVSRAKYRSLWFRWLNLHSTENLWPPRSRYAQ